ncbi:MAG: sugar ABC transporter permease [Proteobacteria bacterium]|nr:sugar ABC transporter permease [Pseudomonadota bacterium]
MIGALRNLVNWPKEKVFPCTLSERVGRCRCRVFPSTGGNVSVAYSISAAGEEPKPSRSWRPPSAFWFLLPAASILLVVFVGPLLYAFHASLTAWSLVQPGSDQDYVGLDNYRDVLTSKEYWRAVSTTLSYAISAVSIELLLGTGFALLLNLDFFFRSLFRSVMVIPMVITPAVVGIFWRLLYEEQAGIFNYYLSNLGLPKMPWLGLAMSLPSIIIMDVWQTTPFFMLIILAGLQSIDENVIAAARVDGASAVQLFRYITLPFLVPYMLIAASFRIIAAMGDFDKIYLLTAGGPGDVTTTISIFAYKTGFNAFDIGRTAAIAWLSVALVLTVSSPLLWHLFKATAAERH